MRGEHRSKRPDRPSGRPAFSAESAMSYKRLVSGCPLRCRARVVRSGVRIRQQQDPCRDRGRQDVRVEAEVRPASRSSRAGSHRRPLRSRENGIVRVRVCVSAGSERPVRSTTTTHRSRSAYDRCESDVVRGGDVELCLDTDLRQVGRPLDGRIRGIHAHVRETAALAFPVSSSTLKYTVWIRCWRRQGVSVRIVVR
jgi:hypothetical protein